MVSFDEMHFIKAGDIMEGSKIVRSLILLLSAVFAGVPAIASASAIAMHRDPGCGCCEKWAAQVRRQFGRDVRIVDDADRTAFRRSRGVPPGLVSCHTAVVDGLAFEGHVPVADMKRALTGRPRGVRGLAVAGMPLGSPGMEVPGARAQAFDVVAFGPAGQRVYARHSG
ncbi:hypothetical protein GCM10011380_36070 [Sphingomonas metalli]|uniref:Metal-binding protein n=2 Tax=Sphingomonas metalli TaxID=1779358 RepID=A0A916WZS4_9SPHN|nr:hypothetical protein GCM10011380_36070 [Sphingomonas metalli]